MILLNSYKCFSMRCTSPDNSISAQIIKPYPSEPYIQRIEYLLYEIIVYSQNRLELFLFLGGDFIISRGIRSIINNRFSWNVTKSFCVIKNHQVHVLVKSR